MDAKELIRAGRLSEARTQSIEEVKASPADAGKRTLLFQIRCLCGEWDKAECDLDIIAAMDVNREAGAQVYKNLLSAEKERLEVFRNGRRPSFMPGTPPYIETWYAACEKLAEKKIEESAELFSQIDSQTSVLSGTLNGKSFSGIKDTDIYVSRFLEVFAHERYVWVPFEAVRELTITPPKTLFDLIWAPAVVTTWKGLTLNCFLPVLYAESYLNEDDHIKLGRITDWKKLGGPFDKGMGQHVYEIGKDEVAILEVSEITFNPPVEVKDEKRD